MDVEQLLRLLGEAYGLIRTYTTKKAAITNALAPLGDA
jgi:hypothetical protein